MRSCLYEGTVWHRRSLPVAHAFRFRLFMVFVDLRELEPLFGRRGFWSTRWPALARFRREDHLGEPGEDLDAAVRRLVASRQGWRPLGPICLLTNFRYCGFRMNPVSIYFCFDAAGNRLEALVAEVTNTPWDEQHCYVLDLRNTPDAERMTIESDKEFHVSPFLPMDLRYGWQLGAPAENLKVQLLARTLQGEPLLTARLAMRRRPLTRWQLARAVLRYPLLTTQVFVAIYWHALRLWWKGVTVVAHPGSSVSGQGARPMPARPRSKKLHEVSP